MRCDLSRRELDCGKNKGCCFGEPKHQGRSRHRLVSVEFCFDGRLRLLQPQSNRRYEEGCISSRVDGAMREEINVGEKSLLVVDDDRQGN